MRVTRSRFAALMPWLILLTLCLLPALAFAAREPVLSERLLFEARRTDAVLDASAPPHVSADLRARILQSAPERRRAARERGLPWWVWAPGAGLAAACAAGALFGAVATAQFARDTQADTVLAANVETSSGVLGAADDDVELL